MIAGVKAAQMYKQKREKWIKAMAEVTDKYARERQSGKRTKREAQNWPEGGYKALSKLARDLQSELQHLTSKKSWNTRDLYHYQRFLIVLFYSKHALRGDLADVKIRKPFGSNWLKKAGSKYELHVGEHKTSKAHGAIELTMGPELQKALNIFLPQARRLNKHGFLLSTLRTGSRLQRQDMLRLIRNLTKERLGKNIGVQIIRVLKVSAAAPEIDKAVKLQQEMGHGGTMQQKYISR
jgi:nitrate/nitrite-specific signal transduction histidine kinase